MRTVFDGFNLFSRHLVHASLEAAPTHLMSTVSCNPLRCASETMPCKKPLIQSVGFTPLLSIILGTMIYSQGFFCGDSELWVLKWLRVKWLWLAHEANLLWLLMTHRSWSGQHFTMRSCDFFFLKKKLTFWGCKANYQSIINQAAVLFCLCFDAMRISEARSRKSFII